MNYNSSKTTFPASGDPLTDMLRGLRLDGVDYGRCVLGEPWAVSFPAQKAARFHFIGQQGCWLFSPAKEWIELSVGDALLIPRGDEHVLASAPGVPPVPIGRYTIEPVCENIYDVSNGCDGCKTLLFCGSMHFNLDGSHPLLDMMPDLMQAHKLMANAPGIQHLLDAMAGEVTMDRVGSGGILARLADV
ncbi:MAG: AraC family transcriptional regulator, partial [Mesorhizobium sp.]